MDCSPPGPSVHGIFQARVLEWGANLELSLNCTILHLGGGLFSAEEQETLLYIFLVEEPRPCQRLHYCFLTAPPLSLHPLPSLISNSLNLSLELRESQRGRMKPISYKQEWGTQKGFVPPQGLAWFHWLCCYQLDSQQLAQPLGKSGGKQTLTTPSVVSRDPARNAKPQTSDLFQNHCIWICILTRSTIQFSSVTQSCLTLCDPMDCNIAGFPVHHQLSELAQTHVHWVGDVIQPSHPMSSPSPPAFNLSQHQGLFKWVSSSHQVANVLDLQLQYQPFQWIFRTNFLRMDCYELLAVQRTLKSLLQHHSSKAWILQCSAFFIVHFPHPYMTTGKTISSVQFSRSVVSDSLWPHESQHARPPCPPPTLGVHSDSRPLS